MSKYRVEKSVIIHADLHRIYQLARDIRLSRSWSPWLIADPECLVTYSEDGKSYSWDGRISGAGENKVIAEVPNERFDSNLLFLKPWKSRAAVSMSFQNVAQGVKVTWTLDSSLPLFLFWMKNMMTALIGMDYQRGLHMLKVVAEMGELNFRLEFPGFKDFQESPYIGISNQCSIDGIAENMQKDFQRVQTLSQNLGIILKSGLSIYHKWDVVKGITEYTIGFLVDKPVDNPPGGLVSGKIPSMKTYVVRHHGSYSQLGNAWASGMMHKQAKIFQSGRQFHPFEIYENNPETTPEADLVTSIVFPVKA